MLMPTAQAVRFSRLHHRSGGGHRQTDGLDGDHQGVEPPRHLLSHPFVNGNGRTARALCYFVVCIKFGRLLPGAPILPELIRRNHEEYVELLRSTDAVSGAEWERALNGLGLFVLRLLNEQVASVGS